MNSKGLHYNLRNRRSFKRRSIELRWLIVKLDVKVGKVSVPSANKFGRWGFHDILVGDRA